MKKIVVTKFCEIDNKIEKIPTSSFERKLENYVKKKIGKILDNPDTYPFITVIDERE